MLWKAPEETDWTQQLHLGCGHLQRRTVRSHLLLGQDAPTVGSQRVSTSSTNQHKYFGPRNQLSQIVN